jgi:hypothetical protein
MQNFVGWGGCGGLDVEVCQYPSFRSCNVWLLGRALGLIRYSVATLCVNFIFAHRTWGRVGYGGMTSSMF